MRAFIVVVLVALFAVAMAADRSERIQKWINKAKEIKPDVKDIIKSGRAIGQNGRKIRDATRRIRDKIRANSDAEIFKKLGKLVKKVAPIVKKGIQIYSKVKGMGILSEEFAPKLEKAKSKVRDVKQKFNKLKSRAQDAKGKFNKFRAAAKNFKKATKTESDFGFGMLAGLGAKLLAKKLGKKKSKKNQEQSDAEIFGKIKKWWDEKGKNLFNKAKDLYGKGKQIYDMFKKPKAQETTEADAEIFGKIKKWWDEKGKGLFNKAKDLYGKGKQIYDMFKKPKAQETTESDAELFGKLKKWWDDKGKNLFNKAKDLYGKGKQIYDMFKKPKAQEAAPEADSDATTNCGMAFQGGQQLGNKQCVLVQGKPVVVETAIAFEKLNAAAKAAGIHLQVNSGFRTQKEQEYLYNCYKTKKCNNGNLAARPGFSNHQNGRAMDISCSNPKVFNWMKANASKFGFIRTVASENWHWELLPGKKCNSVVSYSCN